MSERNFLPVLVVTQSENDAEVVNSALRGAGHAVRSQWVSKLDDLQKSLSKQPPDLVFAYTKGAGAGLQKIVELVREADTTVPVIAVSEDVSEDTVAKAMQSGARDLVSLDKRERLIAVSERELEVLRMARQLKTAEAAIREYQARFDTFLEETGDALAYIQEGIHISSNPTYLEMFGVADAEELEGLPVMDMCAKNDRPKLKEALRSVIKGEKLEVPISFKGVTQEGEEFEVKAELSYVEMEGEPCVELAIRGESGDSKELEEKVRELEKRDQLTGLYNRGHFSDVLAETFGKKSKAARALVCLEPDKFENIKQKMGVVATDGVVKQLGSLINEHATDADICARFEGGLFLLILERKDFKEIEKWCGKLREAIATQVFESSGRSTSVAVSIGLADMAGEAKNADDLLSRAQEAMLGVRADGGNAVRVYTPPEMDEEGRILDAGWVKKIKAGLENNRFQLVQQPIASLQGDSNDLVDILVRLLDEDDKEILPNEFIPAAERNDLMAAIDRWVIEQAIKQLRSRAQENSKTRFFLRLSSDSLADGKLMPWIGKLLKDNQVSPQNVVFEVPETAIEQHLKEAKALVAGARKIKAGFAVEHFGTGDNSMQLLEHLDMDFMKIDGSYMNLITTDEAKREEVAAFLDKAKSKDIATVAERVENANTMAVLWQLGVQYIQGNYVQEPEVVMAEN